MKQKFKAHFWKTWLTVLYIDSNMVWHSSWVFHSSTKAVKREWKSWISPSKITNCWPLLSTEQSIVWSYLQIWKIFISEALTETFNDSFKRKQTWIIALDQENMWNADRKGAKRGTLLLRGGGACAQTSTRTARPWRWRRREQPGILLTSPPHGRESKHSSSRLQRTRVELHASVRLHKAGHLEPVFGRPPPHPLPASKSAPFPAAFRARGGSMETPRCWSLLGFFLFCFILNDGKVKKKFTFNSDLVFICSFNSNTFLWFH